MLQPQSALIEHRRAGRRGRIVCDNAWDKSTSCAKETTVECRALCDVYYAIGAHCALRVAASLAPLQEDALTVAGAGVG